MGFRSFTGTRPDGEVAAGHEPLSGLHPNVCGQASLPVTHLAPLHRKLALGHADAAVLPAVEVERQRHTDRHVVVGAERLLTAELERRVRTQPGLAEASLRGVDLRADCPKILVVDNRTRDELLDAERCLGSLRLHDPAVDGNDQARERDEHEA